MIRPRLAAAVLGVSLLPLTGCAPADEGAVETAAPPVDNVGPRVAFELGERDLLPENLAYDGTTDRFFVGSTRKGKIVRVDREGNLSDFTAPREHGMWMVMGMKVDEARRHLWVASADGDNLAGYARGRGRDAGVFQFDIDSGDLVRKWIFDDGSTHFLNDLVVDGDGRVYVTHMFNQAAVWVLEPGADEFEVFARPGGFRNPNGLDLGGDGRLYVAHQEGVSAFDPATGERQPIADPDARMATPADGLYCHRGALIGVHPQEGVIRRYRLDESRSTIVDAETLAADDPALDDPTTGVLVGDTLYYIGNSQFGRLSNGTLPPADELEPVAILELDL